MAILKKLSELLTPSPRSLTEEERADIQQQVYLACRRIEGRRLFPLSEEEPTLSGLLKL